MFIELYLAHNHNYFRYFIVREYYFMFIEEFNFNGD